MGRKRLKTFRIGKKNESKMRKASGKAEERERPKNTKEEEKTNAILPNQQKKRQSSGP